MSATGLPPAAELQQQTPFADSIPSGTSSGPTVPLANDTNVALVSARDLDHHLADWQDLAAHAAQPNVFLEPWFLRPAIEAFAGATDLRFALVYRPSTRQDTPPLLCGLFPLEQDRRWKKLPLRVWRLWRHDYSFLSTPLVRAGHEADCLNGLLDAIEAEQGGPALLELPNVDGAGPFHRGLVEVLGQRSSNAFCLSELNRAILETGGDWQQYVVDSLTSHNRRELRRQRRRLADQGDITVRISEGTEFTDYWMEQFLRLEADGWKGKAGTAIGLDGTHRQFFHEITHAAAQRGQLMLLGLFLNNEPIAMKWNFRSGEGSFAFKIAYDESFAKFSPGVHLEIENIRLLHQQPDIRWMDSCAVPQHFMINRLWRQRRTIRHLLISTGRLSGDAVVALAPLARVLRRRWRSIRHTGTARPNAPTS